VNRAGLSIIVLVAALTAACGANDGGGSPTAPTPPPSSTPPPSPSPTNPSCAPGAATNLRVSVVDSTRTLTWTAGSNATDYTVQIGTASGSSNMIYTNTTLTTYTWTGANPGTYYARVHSRNSCGQGAPSNEVVFN